jgi:putative redox protein
MANEQWRGVKVDWKGGLAFEAVPPTGQRFTMDAHPDSGGTHQGPTPVETLLGAIAACSAMDVVLILQKKRQQITGYRVEVDGTRSPDGIYPRPFQRIVIRHILQGVNLDPTAIDRAVELSDQKYCTVISTLREKPEIESVWEVEQGT